MVLEVDLTIVCEDFQTNEETLRFFFIPVAYTAIFSVIHNTDVDSQNTDNSINYCVHASLIQNQQNK